MPPLLNLLADLSPSALLPGSNSIALLEHLRMPAEAQTFLIQEGFYKVRDFLYLGSADVTELLAMEHTTWKWRFADSRRFRTGMEQLKAMYQTTAAAQTSSSTGPVVAGQQSPGPSVPHQLQGVQAVAQVGGRTDHPKPH